MGKALVTNTGLKHLDISYSSLTIKSCMVLAQAVKVNTTLIKMIMDGNNVGKVGSENIMSALRESASEDCFLEVSLYDCNIHTEDKSLFNPQYPTKPDITKEPHPKSNPPYELDLETPYGYMVAAELLELANKREGCSFTMIQHDEKIRNPKTKRMVGKVKKIKLERKKEENSGGSVMQVSTES